MIVVEVKIPLTPVPKARPRFGNGKARTPERTKSYERGIALACAAKLPKPPPTCPVEVWIRFSFQHDERRAPHVFKPDLDNLTKTLDALNGLAWKDDAQIFRIEAEKRWASESEVHMIIKYHEQE